MFWYVYMLANHTRRHMVAAREGALDSVPAAFGRSLGSGGSEARDDGLLPSVAGGMPLGGTQQPAKAAAALSCTWHIWPALRWGWPLQAVFFIWN